MTRELHADDLIEPGSPEWLRVITPSKVAAIVGVSRYESPYGLWHRMKGVLDPEPHKDIFDTGHAFELALGYLWKVDNPGWRLSQGASRPGSTRNVVQVATNEFGFPAVATLDRRASRGTLRRVVEFKTARSLEDWGDEFTGDCPGDYYTQVQMLMAFTGWTKVPAHLTVMGPFFRHYTYEIEFRGDLVDTLMHVCRQFWASLAADTPPPLDQHKATYQAVRDLHPDIDRGVVVDVPRGLITELREAKAQIEDAKVWERGCTTRLLDLMNGAQYARVGETIVADRRNHASGSVALVVNKKPFATQTAETEGEKSA